MIEINQVEALFRADKVILPPYQLYQLNWSGRRYYYTYKEDGTPIFYDGVTSVIKNTIPESEGLKAWRDNMGAQEAERYMNERALYGSLMHTCFTRLLIDKLFDLNQLEVIVKMYCEKNSIPYMPQWTTDLGEDIAAFTQWILDCHVKPILIEAPLLDNDFYLGGMVDLVCQLTIERKGYWGEVYKTGVNAGQPKETKKAETIFAIVDYKSSRSGSFYLSHQLQLGMYERMVKQTFPQFKDKQFGLYNWSPKNWRSEPGYNFTEQTGKHPEEVYYAIRTLYDLLNPDISARSFVNCSGLIDLGQPDPLSEVVKKFNITDYVARKNQKARPGREKPVADSRIPQSGGEGDAGGEDVSPFNGLL